MAKARTNSKRKGGRMAKSAGCGLRSNARPRRSAAMRRRPAPCTSRRRNHAALQGPAKNARAPRVFLLLFAWSASRSLSSGGALRRPVGSQWCRGRAKLRDHQHIEDNDRRQAQDHRPDAERPKDVLGPKALLFRNRIFFGVHDAPALLFFSGTLIRRRILKSRPRFRLHLTTGATAD